MVCQTSSRSVLPLFYKLTLAFIIFSLVRSGTERQYPWQLLSHPFIVTSESKKVNMGKWVAMLSGWPTG